MVFEHRNYLALFGPVLSLVLGTLYACENLKCSAKSISVLAFIVILILAGQTMLRTLSWSSIESFAANHLINHPGSVRTHILLADIAFKNGNREVALSELEQVSRINPADISHHVLRVLAWCKDGVTKQQMDDAVNATASISYRKSARSVLYAIRKIENNYATGICPAVSSKDLLRLTSALISNDVIRNLSLKYHLHARALVSNNMLDDARSYYLKAWRVGPLNTHPVFELVELLNERQLYKDACEIVAEFDKYQVKYNNNDATEIARLKNACHE